MTIQEPRLRFTKIRDVKTPKREYNSAGYDFFIPEDLTVDILRAVNQHLIFSSDFAYNETDEDVVIYDTRDFTKKNIIKGLLLRPHQRILIPSGIKVLIEPTRSMLQVNNKSGMSTKKGLIFTANIIDSDYTGEIHLGVHNTSNKSVMLEAGSKLVQLIHIPIYTPELEYITNVEFNYIAESWVSRGENGFGSKDK